MSAVNGRLGDELELRALGRAIWVRRWHILGPAIILGLLAFIAVNVITPLYRSEARILIEGRDNVYLRPEADKCSDRNVIDPEAMASQSPSWLWPTFRWATGVPARSVGLIPTA